VLDPNNRAGGPHLIVTAKTANVIQFFDAGTPAEAGQINNPAPTGEIPIPALAGEINMPASTHELVLAADGRKAYASVYGGGIFGKNTDPDRRIAVIDLPSRSLERMIDLGAAVAPHGLMMDRTGTLWATAELGQAVLAVDPASGRVETVPLGAGPHWIAVSHTTGKLFASFKATGFVGVVDMAARRLVDRIAVPNLAEGVAVSPDGATLYVCAHRAPEFYAVDAASHALRATVPLEGADGAANQLRRVRISPDGAHLLVASHVDSHVAIYEAGSLRQTASVATPKAPMGFGFAADGRHAYLCCHDAAVVVILALPTGRIVGEFPTRKGCEFVISYL
jgi:DNA-binding beta-propeller fold protein YncE